MGEHGKLTEVAVADILAEVRRIQQTPCPGCGGLHHAAVDLDGPGGEYLRYCPNCGRNFTVKA
jgi:transcription elongation factor Elf1